MVQIISFCRWLRLLRLSFAATVSYVRASNLPSGAFIMDEDGNKNGSDGLLTLSKVHSDKTLYKNGNDMAYGQVFYFCVPKSAAEQMDAAGTKLSTSFLTSMNVDRYNVVHCIYQQLWYPAGHSG